MLCIGNLASQVCGNVSLSMRTGSSDGGPADVPVGLCQLELGGGCGKGH